LDSNIAHCPSDFEFFSKLLEGPAKLNRSSYRKSAAPSAQARITACDSLIGKNSRQDCRASSWLEVDLKKLRQTVVRPKIET
jgi:hypothetical protein